MVFSNIGETANNYWMEIPKHFRFVKLHEYIIMPNHVHGILEIMGRNVDSRHGINLRQFGPLKSGSIPVIIGQFKASVTRWCNKNGLGYFGWQRRYYDHIIRNKRELRTIGEYIKSNPYNWGGDKI